MHVCSDVKAATLEEKIKEKRKHTSNVDGDIHKTKSNPIYLANPIGVHVLGCVMPDPL